MSLASDVTKSGLWRAKIGTDKVMNDANMTVFISIKFATTTTTTTTTTNPHMTSARFGPYRYSFGDIHGCALSLAMFLSGGANYDNSGEGAEGSIKLRDLKEFINDCNSHPANVRATALHIGRKLEISGGKLGISGGEMLRRVFGEVGMVEEEKFKKGIASLKPKLVGGADDLDDLIAFVRLGNGEKEGSGESFVSINKLEQIALPATEGSHKRLQGLIRAHFECDEKLVKSFVLTCKDMDYDDCGGLSWQSFCKALDSSTLLLTLSQSSQLCTLLTRDIGSAEGKGTVNYMEIKRIAKGDVLTMPRINKNFEPAAAATSSARGQKMATLGRSKSEGGGGSNRSLGSSSNTLGAGAGSTGTKSLSNLRSATKVRLLGAGGGDSVNSKGSSSRGSRGSTRKDSGSGTPGGKSLSSLKKNKIPQATSSRKTPLF